MEAARRQYGLAYMVSGVMNLENVCNPVATLGQTVPEPTQVTGIVPEQAEGMPYFSVVAEIDAEVRRILATKQDSHFVAVDEIKENVARVFQRKATNVFEPN
jgi:hypothetical protein